MKNSFRQLFRMPLKTGLFCMIFISGTMLFSVGLNLRAEISEKIKAMDSVFVTIGTVSQKEQSTAMTEQWDAGLKEYTYYETNVYGNLLGPELLESLDVEYVSGPKQRPYFGACPSGVLTGGELVDEDMGMSIYLVEIRALEDCVPDGPVPVEVSRVLWGTRSLLGKTIPFCDHRTRQPEKLEAGKRYITFIGVNPMNVEKHEGFDGLLEYMPLRLYKNQTRLWQEAAGDENARHWERIAGMLELCHEKMVPVTPVNDLQLLRPFHNGSAVLVEGREMDREEYESGAKVCLIPQKFAKMNDLQVGDDLPLEFYFADYKYPLCEVGTVDGGLMAEALDGDGNPLDAFQESEYEIIGIYSCPVTLTNDPYTFTANQIFVPESSVSENFEDHVLEQGPMQGYNTAFRIPNGSTERWMEEFSKLPESRLLEIEFDDGGYETFASKMRNTRIVAGVLSAAGLALLSATTAFLMYFMILKQRSRTAVEQALGMTKRQCAVSLLSGIVILTAVCGTVGAAAGMKLDQIVRDAAEDGVEEFSTAYTKGILEKGTEEEMTLVSDSGNMWGRACLVVGCETGIVWILAIIFVGRNLAEAPIRVLSMRG